MRLAWKILAIGVLIVFVRFASGFSKPTDNHAVFDDILNKRSAGSEVSVNGHAICLDRSDTIAFIGLGEVGGQDSDKTKEAQRTALLNEERCTVISGGVRYDVDAEGREVYKTPHGVLALWPAP